MGKGKTPPPPDYTGIAKQQASENQDLLTQQTWANRMNQTTPWGSQTYSATPGVDPISGKPITQWSQNTTLNPMLQRGAEAQFGLDAARNELGQQMMGRVAGQLGQPLDTSKFTAWGGTPQVTTQPGFDFGGDRQRAEDAIYKSATSRLDPQWQTRQRDMETQLANSGITRNSEAYSKSMDDFNRNRSDDYQMARMSAITGAGSEAERNARMTLAGQQQGYQQQLGAGGFQDEQRQRMLAEASALRGLPMNEMSSLLQGSQIRMPTFGDYAQMDRGSSADLLGAANSGYGAQIEGANAKQASQGQMIGAAATVAAAFI